MQCPSRGNLRCNTRAMSDTLEMSHTLVQADLISVSPEATMARRRAVVCVVLILAALIITGCGVRQPFIVNLGWWFENIDPGYWSGSPPPTTMFANFQAVVDDAAISESDIEFVEVRNSGLTWRWDAGDIPFNERSLTIELFLLAGNWPSHTIPTNGWTVEVGLKNGHSDSWDADYPTPGTSTVDPALFAVYSEDYVGATSGMVPMVPRANITNVQNDGTNITLDFTATDPNVYNCSLWFYDSNGYVGHSDYGINWTSGLAKTSILSSGPLDNTGGTNTFDIQASDVVFYAGVVPLASITEVRVVLTDGAQYSPGGSYDYRSISNAVFP